MNRDGLSVELHVGDLPDEVPLGESVAVDTETMGLNPHRDRLCLVQLSAGDGVCHLVQFPREAWTAGALERGVAPNLCRLLQNSEVTKIFHFARFDVGVLYKWLGVVSTPVYCTKVASKLVRTYTDRHGLKELCRELLGVELAKEQQSSDWGRETLIQEQCQYAASDVAYLHRLRAILDGMLEREGRSDLAKACFEFLPARSVLDITGWPDADIFAY